MYIDFSTFLSNHLLSFISDDIFNGNYDDGIVVKSCKDYINK